MKRWMVYGWCFLLIGMLSSACSLFSSKEKRTQKLVAKEMEQIDWNTLDHYPLFVECDELMTVETQRSCFEESLVKKLSEGLAEYELVLEDQVTTVIFIDLLVDMEGKIKVVDMERNPDILAQIPDFNRMIQREVNELPKVEPALKRGVPVNVKFRIPIELNTN
ncbi:MAG: hypothetical protein KJO04_00100 [Bacteroidia bacterium]|nr:hypothetical protein [Bacteroidia bacterium]